MEEEMGVVRCFENGKAVGMVEYTENLDHYDGSNYTSGSTGRHMGIGKTKSGKYYLCFGTQWQGERDHAEIVTKEQAQEAVLRHNPDMWEEMFDEPLPVL